MRRIKAWLFASLLAAGPAFAGQDSTVDGAIVMDDTYGIEPQGDVIYLYPMEVTEYYLVVPSEPSETPG